MLALPPPSSTQSHRFAQPSFLILHVSALLLLGPTQALAADVGWRLRPTKTGKVELVVTNKMKFPITVAVMCPAPAGRAAKPVTVMVRPGNDVSAIVDTDSATPDSACQAGGQVGYRPKDLTPVAIRVPMSVARGVCIGQAFPAERTHRGPERFAIDFLTSIGDTIVATRDGIVYEMAEGFTRGGQDPRLELEANFVKIVHDDGSIALYAHLQTGSVPVVVGQRVKAGQEIGRSGATGYLVGPHLHFALGFPAAKVDPVSGRLAMYYQSINPLFYVRRRRSRPPCRGSLRHGIRKDTSP